MVALIPTCSVLVSCVSAPLQGYDGAVRPDDETALVVLSPARATHARVRNTPIISIERPDGTVFTETNRVRVLPGPTCIAVRAMTVRSLDSYSALLCVEAEAGKTYDVRVETAVTMGETMSLDEYRIVRFRLVDRATQETVWESAPSVNQSEGANVRFWPKAAVG